MLKFLAIISFVSLFITQANVFGQTAEEQIFKSFCAKLEEQNRNSIFAASLPGTKVIEDPASGERVIAFGEKSPALDSFLKFEYSKKLEILSYPRLPVFPLKDTTLIIDTTYALSRELSYKVGKHFFMLSNFAPDKKESTLIYLRGIFIRSDWFYLSLTFSSWEGRAYNYYYKLEDRPFKVVNSSSGTIMPSFE